MALRLLFVSKENTWYSSSAKSGQLLCSWIWSPLKKHLSVARIFAPKMSKIGLHRIRMSRRFLQNLSRAVSRFSRELFFYPIGDCSIWPSWIEKVLMIICWNWTSVYKELDRTLALWAQNTRETHTNHMWNVLNTKSRTRQTTDRRGKTEISEGKHKETGRKNNNNHRRRGGSAAWVHYERSNISHRREVNQLRAFISGSATLKIHHQFVVQ